MVKTGRKNHERISLSKKLLRKTLKNFGTVSLYKIYRAMIKGQK